MAEDLHYDPLVNALSEQEGSGGMPGVMDPHPPDTGCFQQSLPFVPVGVVADRPPVGLAPNEIAFMPGWPSQHALLELCGAVGSKRSYELRRQRNCAPALVGFEFGELEATAGSLRARRGMAGAGWWTVVTVAAFAAGVRVGATMPPGEPLKLPADGQRPGAEIDVLPPEPKRLTLAQPQTEGDAPPAAVSPCSGKPDDAQRFTKGQWFDLSWLAEGASTRVATLRMTYPRSSTRHASASYTAAPPPSRCVASKASGRGPLLPLLRPCIQVTKAAGVRA